MSTAAESSPRMKTIGDSFALGVAVMLALNVAQRGIGLLRNFGFCQFLSDGELGHWALANSFFVIAAPFAVLGLPGSFGKFVEHYRQRGHLGDYVFKVLLASCLGMSLLTLAMLLFPQLFSHWIYGEQNFGNTIAWTAVTFLTVTCFNIVNELAISLRLMRAVSMMQFLQSGGFAVLGIGGLWWNDSWWVLLPAYSFSSLFGMLPGLFAIVHAGGAELKPQGSIRALTIWYRVLPFAGALWLSNLLTNSFELSDRYMLLHYCSGGEAEGQALVGQFYCGRIVPNLLLSLAMLFSGMLLPYLSADWEQKRHDRIAQRMRILLSVVCIFFMGLSILFLLSSPILFDQILFDRYSNAEEVLPIALAQCIWSSLAMTASSYLMCAEKGRSVSMILLVGIAVNLMLNIPLVPAYGLHGTVVATAIANLLVMLLTFHSVSRSGCPLDRRTYFLSLTPILLCFGIVPAAIGLGALFFVASRSDWILNDRDRLAIDEAILPYLAKTGIPMTTLWPTNSMKD